MRTFRVNKNIEVVCEAQGTRSGFRHIAALMYNGREVDRVKCTYINRTWESYEFESVLQKLAHNTKELNDKEKKALLKTIKGGDEYAKSALKTTALVMAMGEIFGKTQKEKNDWKARMLKAGLGNKGLIMPDDWDALTEDEKERRLDGAREMLGK